LDGYHEDDEKHEEDINHRCHVDIGVEAHAPLGEGVAGKYRSEMAGL